MESGSGSGLVYSGTKMSSNMRAVVPLLICSTRYPGFPGDPPEVETVAGSRWMSRRNREISKWGRWRPWKGAPPAGPMVGTSAGERRHVTPHEGVQPWNKKRICCSDTFDVGVELRVCLSTMLVWFMVLCEHFVSARCNEWAIFSHIPSGIPPNKARS